MRIEPLTPTIGAEIAGVDLRVAGDEQFAAIRAALDTHQVLFFRDQDLQADDHLRVARAFGEIEPPAFRTPNMEHPDVLVMDVSAPKGLGTDRWHADATHRATPPMGAILRSVTLPTSGGDTCFASMTAAYEGLSPAMRSFIDGLHAVNDDSIVLAKTASKASMTDTSGASVRSSVHPVVRVHPSTGRKMLNVNGNWTTRIVELAEAESRAVLDLLFAAVASPDIQCRFRWTPGAVAFWDNRAVQHYAVADYHERRVMQRVTIAGDVPFGPGEHRPSAVAAEDRS